jgi:hypothetical protein
MICTLKTPQFWRNLSSPVLLPNPNFAAQFQIAKSKVAACPLMRRLQAVFRRFLNSHGRKSRKTSS